MRASIGRNDRPGTPSHRSSGTHPQKIGDDGARKELLRLCMSLLYLEDNGVQVMGPIQVILDRASFAQQHGEEARKAFFVERQMIGLKAMGLIGAIREQVFAGVDDGVQVIRDLTKGLSYLVQDQFEQAENKYLDTGLGPREVVIDSSSQPAFCALSGMPKEKPRFI
jgi:hypothetical protein